MEKLGLIHSNAPFLSRRVINQIVCWNGDAHDHESRRTPKHGGSLNFFGDRQERAHAQEKMPGQGSRQKSL